MQVLPTVPASSTGDLLGLSSMSNNNNTSTSGNTGILLDIMGDSMPASSRNQTSADALFLPAASEDVVNK